MLRIATKQLGMVFPELLGAPASSGQSLMDVHRWRGRCNGGGLCTPPGPHRILAELEIRGPSRYFEKQIIPRMALSGFVFSGPRRNFLRVSRNKSSAACRPARPLSLALERMRSML